MLYDNEVSLSAFLSSLCWINPENHVALVLVKKDEDGENDYVDIPCTVYNVARYANARINNVSIEDYDTLSVMIYED